MHITVRFIACCLKIYTNGRASRERWIFRRKAHSFAPLRKLKAQRKPSFARLKKQNFLVGLDRAHFISAIVDFYERTNELHPFREGNGRTQRVFLSQLARHAGYVIDFARVDPDDLMIATIQAAGGVDDYLKVLFDEMVV